MCPAQAPSPKPKSSSPRPGQARCGCPVKSPIAQKVQRSSLCRWTCLSLSWRGSKAQGSKAPRAGWSQAEKSCFGHRLCARVGCLLQAPSTRSHVSSTAFPSVRSSISQSPFVPQLSARCCDSFVCATAIHHTCFLAFSLVHFLLFPSPPFALHHRVDIPASTILI